MLLKMPCLIVFVIGGEVGAPYRSDLGCAGKPAAALG